MGAHQIGHIDRRDSLPVGTEPFGDLGCAMMTDLGERWVALPIGVQWQWCVGAKGLRLAMAHQQNLSRAGGRNETLLRKFSGRHTVEVTVMSDSR